MADITVRFGNGTEICWQLPDPDTEDLAGDAVSALRDVLGEPDAEHAMADRLPGWPH